MMIRLCSLATNRHKICPCFRGCLGRREVELLTAGGQISEEKPAKPAAVDCCFDETRAPTLAATADEELEAAALRIQAARPHRILIIWVSWVGAPVLISVF